MNVVLLMLFLLFVPQCGETTTCEDWGAEELGSNIVLFDGDREEDRVIILCVGRDSLSGCCKSGTYLLPTYAEHQREREYLSYVDTAVVNESWVTARIFNREKTTTEYWLLFSGGVYANPAGLNTNIVMGYTRIGPLTAENYGKAVDILGIQSQMAVLGK